MALKRCNLYEFLNSGHRGMAMDTIQNLYEDAVPATGESFGTLLEHGNVKIVRIVSSGTPDHSEYLQEEDEWVAIIEGEATVEIEGCLRHMGRGDVLFIPAHTPHRVVKTSHGTIWIAVHIDF